MTRTIAFLSGVLLCVGVASAQYADFTLSGGYSHFYPEHSGGLNFSKEGAFVDGDFAFRVPGPVPLFAGVGLSASGYWESSDFWFVDNNNFVQDRTLWSDVETVAVEPRLAVKLKIPGLEGFFVKPMIGAGLLVDDYAIDTPSVINNVTFIQTFNHTGAAFEIRPAIEAGWSNRGLTFGGVVSYMAAWGGFGQMGDMMQELRVGLFVGFRF